MRACLVRQERCWYGDQEGIRFFGLRRDGQLAGFKGRFDKGTQPRLVDVDAAVFQCVDDSLVDIHPENLDAMCGKGAGRWQTDVAQAQDTDFLKVHLFFPVGLYWGFFGFKITAIKLNWFYPIYITIIAKPFHEFLGKNINYFI